MLSKKNNTSKKGQNTEKPKDEKKGEEPKDEKKEEAKDEKKKEVKAKKKERKIYWIMNLININKERRRYAFTTEENVSYKLLWEKMTLILGADVHEITYDRGRYFSDVLINSDESLSLAIEYMEDRPYNYRIGFEVFVTYYHEDSLK